MITVYKYKLVKENLVTGERGKRCKYITQYEPLDVGGLYVHLGNDFPGFWRVLELVHQITIED